MGPRWMCAPFKRAVVRNRVGANWGQAVPRARLSRGVSGARELGGSAHRPPAVAGRLDVSELCFKTITRSRRGRRARGSGATTSRRARAQLELPIGRPRRGMDGGDGTSAPRALCAGVRLGRRPSATSALRVPGLHSESRARGERGGPSRSPGRARRRFSGGVHGAQQRADRRARK